MEGDLQKLHAKTVTSGPYKGSTLGELPLEYLQKVALRGVKHDATLRNYARARVAIDQLSSESLTTPADEPGDHKLALAVCKPLPKTKRELPTTAAEDSRWSFIFPLNFLRKVLLAVPLASVAWVSILFFMLVRPKVGKSAAKAVSHIFKLCGSRVLSTVDAFFSQLSYELDDFIISMLAEFGWHSHWEPRCFLQRRMCQKPFCRPTPQENRRSQ